MSMPFEIETLVREADALPHCEAQVALYERAVALADSVNDLQAGYELRLKLMMSAVFAGRTELMFVAFSWCSAQSDRRPEQFPIRNLLWQFKWFVDNLGDFPQISLTQINAAFDDMRRRYVQHGASLHAVWNIRRQLSLILRDFEESDRCHEEFKNSRRDEFSNCIACVSSGEIEYFAGRRRWELAVESFDRHISDGKRCLTQPAVAYSRVLLPLAKLERWDEAREYQRKGYRLARNQSGFTLVFARHLYFAALDNNVAAAKRMAALHTEAALRATSVYDRMQYVTALGACALCIRRSGGGKITLPLPAEMQLADAKGKVDVAALLEWCRADAVATAELFDKRNGNSHISREVKEWLSMT
ncbi:MAG: hypothetical protein C0483_16610 [Pirellula sp.]|nr:hypothetical protein [Pirellula sp.]